MASKAAQKRLTKEYVSMQKEPPPFVWAIPDEKNILTWNYLIRGPPDSPFVDGEYHGVLIFPAEYPFKPPAIKMFTPSGRFQPDKKICFSMSDFHPGTWNPAWSVATILTGLLSFMLSDEMTTGSVTSSDGHKQAYAARSHSYNLSQPRFKEAFPEYCTDALRDLPNMGERERGNADAATTTPPASPTNSTNATVTNSASLFSPPVLRSTSATHQSQVRDTSRRSLPPLNANDAAAVVVVNVNNSLSSPTKPTTSTAQGWTGPLRQVLWEKWRWGVLIAFAVIVSRLSSSP